MRAEELLQAHITRCGGTVLLRLTGELDLATTRLLARAADAALASCPCHLLLDLTHLVFCDRTGLRALRRLAGQARSASADLRLTGLHPHLRRVFPELMDLSSPDSLPPAR
ncbi:STAS domain-containing protein [Streptomyces sp. NPDC055607]